MTTEEERPSDPLCPRHHEDWMRALDLRPTHEPALVQIGGRSDASVLRHAMDTQHARFERWRATVRNAQQLARDLCARGVGCTTTTTTREVAA